jgi:ankyrin repeat protein
MLLEWNKGLIRKADRSTGSTPLHFAASWGKHEVISLLLAADPSAAYQPDKNGSFPIHVAAFANKVEAISVLLDTRRDCVELCDAMGKTFLHVAVEEDSPSVVKYACMLQGHGFSASSFINMQDDGGNTALHFAVEKGALAIFNQLIKNRLVMLDVTNNKGQTPLDLSWTTMPSGVYYGFVSICSCFMHAYVNLSVVLIYMHIVPLTCTDQVLLVCFFLYRTLEL